MLLDDCVCNYGSGGCCVCCAFVCAVTLLDICGDFALLVRFWYMVMVWCVLLRFLVWWTSLAAILLW